MSLDLSRTAGKLLSQAGSGLSVRMTYREKGGCRTMLSDDIGYCAIMDLQNAFLDECLSDLAGTEMRILESVLDYFVLVFLR
jgi:hypothetical protein